MTHRIHGNGGAVILFVVFIAAAAGAGGGGGHGSAASTPVQAVAASAPAQTVSATNSNEALANQMAAAYGWTGDQAGCLDQLWTHEDSTWSPTQPNLAGSPAYGIPQADPGDKMASAGADWQTNPATQIRWGLGYIKDAYGNPCTAWSDWQARSPHWY